MSQPLFIEVCADATHQGKSTLAARIRDFLDDHGIPVSLVRIETSRVTGMHHYDVTIPTENISLSEKAAGGVVSVLKPAYDLLPKVQAEGGAIIVDWAGGLGTTRLKILGAARLDEALERMGFRRVSFVLTTSVLERMEEAKKTILETRDYAPGFENVLVFSERAGNFEFPEGTRMAKLVKDLKQKVQRGLPTMTVPMIDGDALAHLAPAQLSIRELMSRDPAELAETLGSDIFTCSACVSYLAAYYQFTEMELKKLLPFRDEKN